MASETNKKKRVYIIAKVALPWQLDQTPNDESLAQGGTSPNWRLCHRGKQE